MKTFLLASACALATIALGGCQVFQGAAAFNKALAPNLKPLALSVEQPLKCADLVDRMQAASGAQPMSAQQISALVRACEEMQANYALELDPQGARAALEQMIAKSANPAALAAGALTPK